MRDRHDRSPLSQLMWAIAFLAILACMFATSRRSDPEASRDSRMILAGALVLFVAYFLLGWRGRRRPALSDRAG